MRSSRQAMMCARHCRNSRATHRLTRPMPQAFLIHAPVSRSSVGREAAEGLEGQGAQVAPVTLSQRAAFAHGVIDGREGGGRGRSPLPVAMRRCGHARMPTSPKGRMTP